MIKNYFLISWRNLLRNKGFSSINLFGLAIGMTCTIFIFLWVRDEMNYNQSNLNYHNIHQVIAHRDFNNQIYTDRNMVLPLAEAIENEIPQIENAVVTTHENDINFSYSDEVYRVSGRTTSVNFFEIFTADFIQKTQTNPLDAPSSIVLTESTAHVIFGDENPLNKVLTVGNDEEFRVTAVVADIPENSSIQFDFLKSFDYSNDEVKESMEEWASSSWEVFISTLPAADLSLIDQQINEIKYRNNPEDEGLSTYFSFPMSKWRLYSDFNEGVNTGGLIEYVRLFTIIAVIILIIACVNFMNLSTARSENRAKEVGVRKTLGSLRKHLIYQFFIESVILSFFAFCLSVLAVLLLLPWFNQLVDKQLDISLTDPYIWFVAVLIILITGIMAGSYPALFLSSFNPVTVLKGTFKAGRNSVLPRQALIVFQFVVSILLISATVIVYQQISLIKNRSMGYDPNNLITIYGSDDTQKNFNVIKQELLQSGKIESVTRTMAPITNIWWRTDGPNWEGQPEDQNIIFTATTTDVDFTKTMGVNLLAGKDFSGSPADSAYMLLNKAAVEAMGLENPVGMKMEKNGEYTILGVTENIIQGSPFEPVDPMMIFFEPNNSRNVSIRLNQGVHPQQALTSIESIFKKYSPHNIFEFRFVDELYQQKFITEDLIRKLSNIFAGLAIFICCIGLAGLAAFTIQKRKREIGIRKVLGATVHQILLLISKEFLKLVVIALLVAIPIAWWFMHQWLQNYQYRIEISPWIFTAVGAVILLLTLAVVSTNTISSALRNPTKSLRVE